MIESWGLAIEVLIAALTAFTLLLGGWAVFRKVDNSVIELSSTVKNLSQAVDRLDNVVQRLDTQMRDYESRIVRLEVRSERDTD